MLHVKIINKILDLCKENAFDINGVDSFDEMAPLHYICENGNEEIFNLFVDFEKRHPNVIDWNIRNKNGMTPLHFAARGRQTKIVDELINNEIICPHVDINAIATGEFENGRTPISFACEKGLIDIVKLLLNDKNEDDENDPFALLSLNKDQKKKVKRGSLCGAKSECDLTIKSKGAHQKGMTALHYACKSSNIEVVKLILNHGGFDINARANGKSCLFLACKHNRIDIVRLLLQQNDINYNIKTPRGVTPLMIAAQEGRKEIVEMLLKQRRIDKNALTANGQSAKSMAKNTAITELFEKYA